jgi:hypothetical protein
LIEAVAHGGADGPLIFVYRIVVLISDDEARRF